MSELAKRNSNERQVATSPLLIKWLEMNEWTPMVMALVVVVVDGDGDRYTHTNTKKVRRGGKEVS